MGDNALRSVYSVYDFGDFEASGKMGDPYVKFLPLVDPNAASKDFAAVRGSGAHMNITYNTVNLTAAPADVTAVSLSDDVTNTLNKINTYFPIMLAILGLNALVILLLAIAAFVYLYRRRSASSTLKKRRTARRPTPIPLEARSVDAFAPPPLESLQHSSSYHVCEPVSALTDGTFVPLSPASHYTESSGFKARSFDDRPKSVA